MPAPAAETAPETLAVTASAAMHGMAMAAALLVSVKKHILLLRVIPDVSKIYLNARYARGHGKMGKGRGFCRRA
jgi:hypothetical protein